MTPSFPLTIVNGYFLRKGHVSARFSARRRGEKVKKLTHSKRHRGSDGTKNQFLGCGRCDRDEFAWWQSPGST